MTEQKGSLVRQLYMPAVLCTALWGFGGAMYQGRLWIVRHQAGQSFPACVCRLAVCAGGPAGPCWLQSAKAQDHPRAEGGMAADPVDQPVSEHDQYHMLQYIGLSMTTGLGSVLSVRRLFALIFRASVPAER